ncbi:MAG: collagen-like protein, partial [Clostridia bacterium]
DKGDTGEAGAKGDQGIKGDTGSTGEAGAKGDQGIKGDTGEAGAKGDQGIKGDTGLTGEAGAKGDKGDAGAKGDKGDQGIKGDDCNHVFEAQSGYYYPVIKGHRYECTIKHCLVCDKFEYTVARDITSLFASGTGEVASPFIISTVTQFQNISKLENIYTQKEYDSWEYKLGADLDFSNIATVTSIPYFAGNIDGAGHTIIGCGGDNLTPQGLFNIYNGNLKNINLKAQSLASKKITSFISMIGVYSPYKELRKSATLVFENITMSNYKETEAIATSNDNIFANYITYCDVLFKNITNKANYFSTYNGAIIGGYSINSNITFENCINEGNLHGNNVGFLFGNGTNIYAEKGKENTYVVKNCLNKGIIEGKLTSGLFCSGIGITPERHTETETKYAPGFTGSTPATLAQALIGTTEFGVLNNELQIRGKGYDASIAKVTVSLKLYLSIHEAPSTSTWNFDYFIPVESATAFTNNTIIALPLSPITLNKTIKIDPTIKTNYAFEMNSATKELTLVMKAVDVNGEPANGDPWKINTQKFVVNAYDSSNKLLESSLFDYPTSMKPLV